MDIAKLWAVDQIESFQYYLSQLWAGAGIKAILGLLAAIYIELFHGNIIILDVYLAFAGVDLALGTWYAIKTDSWSPTYLLFWIRKFVAYVGTVCLFGGLCMTITITTGNNMRLVNWLLLCCIITELGSILKNMKKLDIPLPPVLEVLLRLIRKKASEKIADKLGVDSEEERRELEKAIAGDGKDKEES